MEETSICGLGQHVGLGPGAVDMVVKRSQRLKMVKRSGVVSQNLPQKAGPSSEVAHQDHQCWRGVRARCGGGSARRWST